MACLGLREALMILLFNLVVPSIDQYTDVTIILRLMAGPDPDTHLVSVVGFPTPFRANGTFAELPPTFKDSYILNSQPTRAYVYCYWCSVSTNQRAQQVLASALAVNVATSPE